MLTVKKDVLAKPDHGSEPDYSHSSHHHGLPHDIQNTLLGHRTNHLNAIPLPSKIAMPVTVKSLQKNKDRYCLATLRKL